MGFKSTLKKTNELRYSFGIIVVTGTAALMLALATSGLLYSYKIVGSNALIFHQWGGQLLLVLVFIWIGVRLVFALGLVHLILIIYGGKKYLQPWLKSPYMHFLLLMSLLATLRLRASETLSYCFPLMLPLPDLT